MPLGASVFEDVPLVEFIFLVFSRVPAEVTVGDSGLCCFGDSIYRVLYCALLEQLYCT